MLFIQLNELRCRKKFNQSVPQRGYKPPPAHLIYDVIFAIWYACTNVLVFLSTIDKNCSYKKKLSGARICSMRWYLLLHVVAIIETEPRDQYMIFI